MMNSASRLMQLIAQALVLVISQKLVLASDDRNAIGVGWEGHYENLKSNLPEDDIHWRKTGKLRRIQAADFFPDDDPYYNPFGIMERKPCIPFEQIREDQFTNPNADGECATQNACSDGACCRAYNWLLCDTDSSFPYVSCVCNTQTWPPEQWTRAPTVPRPTSPLSPQQTTPASVVRAPLPTARPTFAPLSPPSQQTAPASVVRADIVDTAIAAGIIAPKNEIQQQSTSTGAGRAFGFPSLGFGLAFLLVTLQI